MPISAGTREHRSRAALRREPPQRRLADVVRLRRATSGRRRAVRARSCLRPAWQPDTASDPDSHNCRHSRCCLFTFALDRLASSAALALECRQQSPRAALESRSDLRGAPDKALFVVYFAVSQADDAPPTTGGIDWRVVLGSVVRPAASSCSLAWRTLAGKKAASSSSSSSRCLLECCARRSRLAVQNK